VILNDLERRNSSNRCVISPNSVDFGADYVKVVEDTPYFLRQESSHKESSFKRYHSWRYWQCSICQKTVGVERRRHENRGAEGTEGGWGVGRSYAFSLEIRFHFKMHSGPFSYTNILKFYLQSNAGKGTSSWYSW